MLSVLHSLANITCADLTLQQCPTEICEIIGDSCVDRLRISFISRCFASFIHVVALTTEACQCSQTGMSGGIQTGVIGCTRDVSFPDNGTTIVEYCYVNGGCPDAFFD